MYFCAIVGALGSFLVLVKCLDQVADYTRFSSVEVGAFELTWLIPLALAGTVCGRVYYAANRGSKCVSKNLGQRPVVKAVLAGVLLAVCGMVLPYTMFAGEAQIHDLMEDYAVIPAVALIMTGLIKCAITPTCINLGWCGGHFFPLIFSGISLGYGFAVLTGAEPVFCVAVYCCFDGCCNASARYGCFASRDVLSVKGHCCDTCRCPDWFCYSFA